MKKFRKILILILTATLVTMLFSGCAKRGVCDECGQKEKLHKFTTSSGSEYWYCADCYRMAKIFE